VDGGGGVRAFIAGACGFAPGGGVPAVIAADGVVGEGFTTGVCAGGAAGLALLLRPGGGATGLNAAEGVAVDCFAAGICDGGSRRLARPAGNGADVAGVLPADGVVAAGVCAGEVLVLPPPAGNDDGVAGAVAVDGGVLADGIIGVTGFAAGTCDGAGNGALGAIAAEGVVGFAVVPLAGGRG
jgi:hypothetical protein